MLICGMNCVKHRLRTRGSYLFLLFFGSFVYLPIATLTACKPHAPVTIKALARLDTLPPTDTARAPQRIARLVNILPVPRILQGLSNKDLSVGAENMEVYLPLLRNKRVGCVVNQTSRVGSRHLVDTLLQRGINVVEIFAPEHGFRGNADAGDEVANGNDSRTNIPIISLYGKKRRPSAEEIGRAHV